MSDERLSRRRGGRTKEGGRTYIHTHPNLRPAGTITCRKCTTADHDMAVQQEKKKSCLRYGGSPLQVAPLHRGGAKWWPMVATKLIFMVHSDTQSKRESI